MRRNLVQAIRQEAVRFKRKSLVKMLEEFEQSMVDAESTVKNNNVQKPIVNR
jgi:hypothetical protein